MKKPKQEKPISDELIDALVKQGRRPEDINSLLKQFTKAVLERALQAEVQQTRSVQGHHRRVARKGSFRQRRRDRAAAPPVGLQRWRQHSAPVRARSAPATEAATGLRAYGAKAR